MMPARNGAAVAVLVVLSGCLKPSAPPPPPPAPVDDCTFDTRLVEGVPGSPGHLIPSELNPNGASELATVMRGMQKDLGTARLAVLDGGAAVAPMWPRHRKIRCSWPTSITDRTATFDGLAVNYLAQVRAFDERPTPATFDNVLSACRACHDASCPGPIVVIEALRVDGGANPPK